MSSYSSAIIAEMVLTAILTTPQPQPEKRPFRMDGYRIDEDGTILEVWGTRGREGKYGVPVTLAGSEITPEISAEIDLMERSLRKLRES